MNTDLDNALSGAIAPVLTPFTTDDRVDSRLFRKEVRYLLDAGVNGISPGGSTGEGAALTDGELTQLVSIAREESSENTPVVAGVIRTSTPAALATAKAAKDAGADALMITPTFYNVLAPDDRGNELFFQTLSDEVQLPIIIYNVVPQNSIRPELALRLFEIEHVMGIKQSVGGIMAMYEMLSITGAGGNVYAATDEMLASCYLLGAKGAISAILALFPKTSVRMWNLVQSGRVKEALSLQDKLYPIWRIVCGGQFPARMKTAAAIMGRECGKARSPLVEVPKNVKEALESALSGIVDE